MRYVIAESWTHFFTEDGRDVERETRFVVDVATGGVLDAEVRRDRRWRAMSDAERADLAESVGANSEFFTPGTEECEEVSDELPDWASGAAPSPSLTA